MTRLALALAIAAALFCAFAIGWVGCWLAGRARRDPSAVARRVAELEAELHAAEGARAAAERGRVDAERAAGRALEDAGSTAAAELAQLRAERDGAMDALGAARRETADWRAAYEAILKEDRETP